MRANAILMLGLFMSGAAHAAMTCDEKSVDELQRMSQSQLTREFCAYTNSARTNDNSLRFRTNMSSSTLGDLLEASTACNELAKRANLVYRARFTQALYPQSCNASPSLPQTTTASISQATTDSQSKEQQIYDLQLRNLPYEQYQREYRRIMGN